MNYFVVIRQLGQRFCPSCQSKNTLGRVPKNTCPTHSSGSHSAHRGTCGWRLGSGALGVGGGGGLAGSLRGRAGATRTSPLTSPGCCRASRTATSDPCQGPVDGGGRETRPLFLLTVFFFVSLKIGEVHYFGWGMSTASSLSYPTAFFILKNSTPMDLRWGGLWCLGDC